MLCSCVVGHDDFDLHFGHEVDGVLGAAIHLGVSLLTAEAAHFGDRHSLKSLLGESVLHVFELEVADDRFDFLHEKFLFTGLRSSPATAVTTRTLPLSPGLAQPLNALSINQMKIYPSSPCWLTSSP